MLVGERVVQMVRKINCPTDHLTNPLFQFIRPMHEVTPKVVAMAVRMVMAMCRIFCQSSFLFIVFEFSF